MLFEPLKLPGAWVIRLEPIADERGSFARSWCSEEYRSRGLNPRLVQCNISTNRRRGTLRGLHYQAPPHEEAKLIRCTRGAVYDVVVDLREGSPTLRDWAAVELSAENHLAVYIPEGCAHGFQTLADDSEMFYQMAESYAPESARGVRWDDPAFAIVWPIPDPLMSSRDRGYPDYPGGEVGRGLRTGQ